MNRIEGLLKAYQAFVAQPWSPGLSAAEKTWFAVYEPAQERRLRLRVSEFGNATRKAGHGWVELDLSNAFAEWMARHKYREAYFDEPEALDLALTDFTRVVAARVKGVLMSPAANDSAVVALLGVGALYGLTKVSDILEQGASKIHGRLLVFFPGRYENSQYRLLDARDGWNYLAVPILPKNGE